MRIKRYLFIATLVFSLKTFAADPEFQKFMENENKNIEAAIANEQDSCIKSRYIAIQKEMNDPVKKSQHEAIFKSSRDLCKGKMSRTIKKNIVEVEGKEGLVFYRVGKTRECKGKNDDSHRFWFFSKDQCKDVFGL